MKCKVDIDEFSEYFSVSYTIQLMLLSTHFIKASLSETFFHTTSKFDSTRNFSPIYINMKIELMYAGLSTTQSDIPSITPIQSIGHLLKN